LNKNWSSSNNGFTRQNDATSGCKQQKRSFFFGSTQRELLVEPKASQSSIDQPQAAFIHNCRSPGGGQGGQKNQRMVVCCSLLDEKAKKKVLGKQG